MKRIIVCLLTIVLLFSTGLVAVSAAGTGTLSATTTSGYRGDTVTVNVNLNSNPGLISMKFQVSYSSNLTLVSVSNSGLLNGWTTPAPTISSPYTLRWADSLATTNSTSTGKLVTLTFKIADNATIGTETVSIVFNESRDCNGSKNTFSNTSATITVKCNHSYGIWSKANDTQHSRTCSVCQNVEKANHTWNSGSITKQPTCKETGVKTFTCTTCNATKTESITKTNDHKYGSWTKVNDTTHKHTCSVCSKEETASHTWNSGTITKQPSCKETGIKTYTCTACNANKTESVAKTTDHKYGNWTKVNDTTHKHSYSVCSKEETANHTWNSGSITKQPSCKETGIKTYTCAGCNGTKTETIAKTTDHKYGNWIKVNDTTHKHTCSVCFKEETSNHAWNSGVVTKKASCKEAGIKTYTCTACNATKTESIAKLTTHTYDHACDTECNVCGITRTTTHNYKTSWSKDKTNHWHECSVCKDKKDVAAHTPGAVATETTAQTCTTCGYIIKAALGHKHNYATTWTTDDAGHWYACSGCAEKGSYATHDFENDCDKDCSICGYTREAEHKFAEAWTTDTTNHWHVCSGCGLKQDEAAHEPGAEATATTAQTCTICGYEIAPALGNEETKVPTENDQTTNPTTTPTAPTDKPDPEDGNFPWWIIAIVAVVAVGGVAAVIVIKKKK